MTFRLIAAGMAIACLVAAVIGLALNRGGARATPSEPHPTLPVGESAQTLTPAASGPVLELPIACDLGEDCEIQNYVDRNPGPGVEDYRSGVRTYEAHNGTDFRIRDMAMQQQGVEVLAAAAGTVLRVRSDVPDISVVERGHAQVAGQECGNGLVIDHGGGLTTQYCHMEVGSIGLRPGERVDAGAVLGRVGLSGQTEYPHLHFTVRRGDQVIDPFLPTIGESAASLWSSKAAGKMAYEARVVLNAGFAGAPISMEAIEAGGVPPTGRDASALVAYVRSLGLKAGDIERVAITGPDGAVVAENVTQPLSGNRAQQMIFAGRRARGGGWPAGVYDAVYSVEAGGQVVLEKRFSITL